MKAKTLPFYNVKIRSAAVFLCMASSFCLFTGSVCGQTNPPGVANLFPLNYTFPGMTASSSVYPNGFQGWTTGSSNLIGITTNSPTGDIPLTPNGDPNAPVPGIVNCGTGFSFMATPSSPNDQVGELCLNIKTLGRQGTAIQWWAKDLGGVGAETNLTLQYRIGNTGSFITLPSATFTSNNGTMNSSANFDRSLPMACDNQPLVQLRWIYYGSPAQSGTWDPIFLAGIKTSSIAGTTGGLEISGTPIHSPTCPGSSATGIQYRITNYAGFGVTSVNLANTNSSEFAITTPLSGTSISSLGGYVTFTVTFAPGSPGPKTTTLTVTASSPFGSNSPSLVLSGTGSTPAAPTVSSSAATNIINTTATLNANLSFMGVCPSVTEKGFVYAKTSDNADPLAGGSGVTKIAVAGMSTGVYSSALSGLSASTDYSFKSYVYDGTVYTYGSLLTFRTLDAASGLIFSVQPPTIGTTGNNLSPFTARAIRPDNSTDIEYSGNISLSSNGIGNLVGTTIVAATAGEAVFNNVQFDAVGVYTITANAATLAAITSNTINYTSGVLAVNFKSITAVRQVNTINLQWKISNELNIQQYKIERSTDGIHFIVVASQSATGNNAGDVTYIWQDINPSTSDNFYRVRSIGASGEIKYSQIASVKMGKTEPAINVYPNPVTNHFINIEFTGLKKGAYLLQFINNAGQTVSTQLVNYEAGSVVETISIDKQLLKGAYHLRIIHPDNKKEVKEIVISN